MGYDLVHAIRPPHLRAWVACGALCLATTGAPADIPSSSGGIVPGTEGLTPAPGYDLSNWNTAGHSLQNAILRYDLTGADLSNSDLTNALFDLPPANVTNANFTGTIINGALFAPGVHFTAAQLFSTASYSTGNLSGVQLYNVYLSNANLAGINFTGATLHGNLSNALFSNATLSGATIFAPDFTAAQLYSTGSYINHDLQSIHLDAQSMPNWHFADQNLSGATFSHANINEADFTNATIAGASFQSVIGLVPEQLYATASYVSGDLSGINFAGNDLSTVNFAGKNLRGMNLYHATLTGADFTNADIREVNFGQSNMTFVQFLASASFQSGDLSGINLDQLAVNDWIFQNLNLSHASFNQSSLAGAVLTQSNLRGATLAGADLTNCNLSYADLTDAYFLGANLQNASIFQTIIRGANFDGTTKRGFVKQQLYETASYAAHDLRDISLRDNDLKKWDFRRQNLQGADFTGTNLDGARFRGADLRGAIGFAPIRTTGGGNMIWPDGHMNGISLITGETLTIHDSSIPISLEGAFSMTPTSALVFMLDEDWDSLISLRPFMRRTLSGTLNLQLAPGVDPTALDGLSFHLFNWSIPDLKPENQFTQLTGDSRLNWDFSTLYIDGEVKASLVTTGGGHTALIASVPEPATLTLALAGLTALLARRSSRRRAPFLDDLCSSIK